MEIRYLREFVELVRSLSFTDAARALGMTQPTLSKHIRSLEASLGMMLFDRSGARPQLTERGSALLPYAYRVIDAQGDFERQVKRLRKSTPPHLTVCGISDERPSTEVLGFLVSLFGERYGTGFLEVKSGRDKTPEELLDRGMADFVLDSSEPEVQRARRTPEGVELGAALLGMLPLVAFVSRDNPLAGRDSVSLSELDGSEVLRFEGIYLERSWVHIERALEHAGVAVKIRSFHCTNVADLLISCAHLGQSVLIVGHNFAERIPVDIRRFCARLDIRDEDAAVPLYLLYRKDNRNPLVRETVAYVEDHPSLAFEFSRASGEGKRSLP